MVDTEIIKKAQSGDLKAKNIIVEQYTRMVWSIVRKVRSTEHEKEDLFQVGCMGLVKAISRFDFKFEVKFSTYAFTYILGEIKRFVRDDGRVKISRKVKEVCYKIQKEKEKFQIENNREPTISELSKILDIPKEELSAIIATGVNSKVKSLYDDLYQKNGDAILLIDKIKSDENIQADVENKLILKNALNKLDDIEKKVILLRYFKEKRQREISEMLGITQVKVSRIEKRALKKMKIEEENSKSPV